jgi:hypothetical protein
MLLVLVQGFVLVAAHLAAGGCCRNSTSLIPSPLTPHGPGSLVPDPDVKGAVEQVLIVGSGVDHDGKAHRGRDAGAGCVERELGDGAAHRLRARKSAFMKRWGWRGG